MSDFFNTLKEKQKGFFLFFFSTGILICLDQWTKRLASVRLKDQPPIVLWKGVFELHYLENRGAAFGMFQGRQFFFFVVAVIVFAAILYALFRMPFTWHYFPLAACLVLLMAGAIGNMIDRISQQFVVDFLYFCLIDFPIFNVADCYVTIAAFLLVGLIMWFYQDDDLLVFSWKRGREV